jgi:hypothetical protein
MLAVYNREYDRLSNISIKCQADSELRISMQRLLWLRMSELLIIWAAAVCCAAAYLSEAGSDHSYQPLIKGLISTWLYHRSMAELAEAQNQQAVG